MSKPQHNDERAFPFPESLELYGPGFKGDIKCCSGLSKRELFAAIAMHAVSSWDDGPSRQEGESYQEATARVACEYADALLRQLAK